jgi:hypothetical protein
MSTGKKILAEITVKDGKPVVEIHNNMDYEVVPLEGVTYIVERKSQEFVAFGGKS